MEELSAFMSRNNRLALALAAGDAARNNSKKSLGERSNGLDEERSFERSVQGRGLALASLSTALVTRTTIPLRTRRTASVRTNKERKGKEKIADMKNIIRVDSKRKTEGKKKKRNGVLPLARPALLLTSAFASLIGRKIRRETLPQALEPPVKKSGAASVGETGVLWFRNDLRIHDNEALQKAMKKCLSILCVYVFEPIKKERNFDRTGPYKCQFTREAVKALRKKLRSLGSDLVIRIGSPEDVLPQLCQATSASLVFCHGEVSKRDQAVEDEVEKALRKQKGNVQLERCWGSSTLHHIKDVPFELESMPANYSAFCKQVENTEIKPAASAPKKMKPWPLSGSRIRRGRVPTLEQLGLPPQKNMHLKMRSGRKAQGGEEVALSHLKRCSKGKGQVQRVPDQLAPWLSLGCISVRRVREEILPSIRGGGMEREFIFELLWRDFFRFSRLKISKGNQKRRYAAAAAV